jgi:hypothetical protein
MTITSPPLTQEHLGDQPLAPSKAAREGYLFSPAIDFLCLGGGSLLIFIPLMFLDTVTYEPKVAATILFLAYFINSPHFAHSYQIFYRNFSEKAFGPTYSPRLRVRYVIAGIIVPAALIVFFATAIGSDSGRALGFGSNIMLFFVGWHYVKQGYGMIIVDSVLKKAFFAPRDKKILTLNAYLCWILSWGALNNAVAQRDMFGLASYSIPVPSILLIAVGLATAVTTLLALDVIYRSWRSDKPFPFNGTIAYLVTLYVWVLLPALAAPAAFVILMVLAIPAAHSIQYLAVVWRYQLNVEHDKSDAGRPRSLFSNPVSKLAYFFVYGVVISFFGFWILPWALELFVPYNRGTFGSQMFLFMFAIFINVHHYFLDNVMWRRENPDIAKYLLRAD